MKSHFSFSGNDIGLCMSVSSVTRNVISERNLEQTTVSGMNGALVKDSGLSPLEITVTGNLWAQKIEEVTRTRRLISAMLMTSEPAKLVLPDERDKYYLAIYQGGAELSRNAHRPSVELTFLCPDPVAFGQSRTQTVTTTQTVVNTGGTYKSYPIVTAKPPSGSSWRITNVSTGDFVLVYATFTGSQTLVLDMEKQRCTINGSDKAVDITSDFFAIEGTQKLQVSGGSATLAWNERWL